MDKFRTKKAARKSQKSISSCQSAFAKTAGRSDKSSTQPMAAINGKLVHLSHNLDCFRENTNPALISMTDGDGRSLDGGTQGTGGQGSHRCMSRVFLSPVTNRETKTLTWITARDRGKSTEYLSSLIDNFAYYRLWSSVAMPSEGRCHRPPWDPHSLQTVQRERELASAGGWLRRRGQYLQQLGRPGVRMDYCQR